MITRLLAGRNRSVLTFTCACAGSLWAATAIAQSRLPPEGAPVVPANNEPAQSEPPAPAQQQQPPPPRDVSPQSEPQPAAPLPPSATIAPPTEPAAPDWAARLNEVEQLARIAARKQEILEEETARKDAARATSQPTTARATADDKGFSLQTTDGDYS